MSRNAEKAAPAWNDPILEACESAPCACGHVALDHAWHGCEDCACTRSAIHALVVSGAVEVRMAEPAISGGQDEQ